MDSLVYPFIMLVTGPKRSGKTYFIRKLLEKKLLKDFDRIIVMSPTQRFSRDFDFLKDHKDIGYVKIKENFTEEANKFWSLLLEKEHEYMPRVLVIMDDLATDKVLSHHSAFAQNSIFHRHLEVSMIIVGHAMRGDAGLPKGLRLQLDYNVIFAPASMQELETILRDCMFSSDVKKAQAKCHKVFNSKYQYIVYQPTAPYDERLLVNWKIPLLKYDEN